MLQKENYSSTGTQILYNGTTGEQIESDIFIGPTYYMRLKHMVKDKINFRARGPNTNLTRQPVQGRANDGGLRIGEMERDGIIAHGATRFLQESMMVRGDNYYLAICNKTGMTAIYNPDNDVFMSPMADGPIQFNDALTDNPKLVNITRFGRSFSVVQIPYSLKLLVQELQTMNCAMRIITEDNISQIESMSFSNNYKILSGEKRVDIEGEGSSDSNVNVSYSAEGGRTRTYDDDDMMNLIISSNDATHHMSDAHEKSSDDIDDDNSGIQENTIDNGEKKIESDDEHIANAVVEFPITMELESVYSEKKLSGMGNEWTMLTDNKTGNTYFYNKETKETMWYHPQPAKDYELRPPFGWYAVEIAGHVYLHNPQKNLIKMPEDVTFADANERVEEKNDDKEDLKTEKIPPILMVEKKENNDDLGNGSDDGSGSIGTGSGDGSKKIIF
jgi:hypothetical protein